ncbi:MAG: hypothetical protein WC614_06920 [bacterium]
MWPFSKKNEEYAKRLRIEAGKLRVLSQFNEGMKNTMLDEAAEKYKEAYAIYVRLGKIDDQCNVLCSLVETARREESQKYLIRLESVCTNIRDTNEKDRALEKLDALKKSLGYGVSRQQQLEKRR